MQSSIGARRSGQRYKHKTCLISITEHVKYANYAIAIFREKKSDQKEKKVERTKLITWFFIYFAPNDQTMSWVR